MNELNAFEQCDIEKEMLQEFNKELEALKKRLINKYAKGTDPNHYKVLIKLKHMM